MLTNETYTKAQDQSAPAAQLKHILLDVDFFDKPKVKGLLYKFGHSSGLFLIRLYMALARATGATISQEAAQAIAYEMRIDDRADDILGYCIDNQLIELCENGFTQDRVKADQIALQAKRTRVSTYVTKHRSNRLQNRLHDAHESTYPDTVYVSDLDNINIQEGGAGETPPAPDLIKLEIDEISLEQLKCTHGPEVVERAILLAESHVNAARGTPDFDGLKRKARNGAHYLGSWALSAARQQLAKEAAAQNQLSKKPPDFETQKEQRKKRELEHAHKKDEEDKRKCKS